MDNNALYKLTYGLFLLTARESGKDNGCIINTAMQVASNPTRISFAVQKTNLTHDMVLRSCICNISSISTTADFELLRRFGMQSGRDGDKFAEYTGVDSGENGVLYLTEHSNMYISAKVTEHFDLGSHTLFIAEITDAQVLSEEESCSYAYYQSDIKAKPVAKTEKRSWTCSVCGYVYEGDEIPDDFECPLCHHGKEDFVQTE
mgnify:CR=1 FL=1